MSEDNNTTETRGVSVKKVKIADWDHLVELKPSHALVLSTDLVIIRYGNNVSVLYGRCLHRGAIMADGFIRGEDIICGVHGWDYRYDTGVSAYNPAERLHKFSTWIEDGSVYVDENEVARFEIENPSPYDRSAYQGAYQDPHGIPEEPYVGLIRKLAGEGLSGGEHGPIAAMGVPRSQLPIWEDIQFVTAQLATLPKLEHEPIVTELVVGPQARRPLRLDIPIIVSDMSFGALSEEAKTALAKGAEQAGTGICSGEGGMLPEEQQANSRYFYELASAKFGYRPELLNRVQAFHFKGGQGAKTGTGGHLPGIKVKGKIAQVRGLKPGTSAVSPARFPDWSQPSDFADFAAQVKEISGGIPVGFKLSAQHIEADIETALQIGVDYLILDGRGGGTGAAPTLFRDNISVPTIPALARARQFLDNAEVSGKVTLFITGGLRTPADFAKALALGADGVAISNSAMQAIGCIAMRACHTNNCPVGIATQKPQLRARLPVDEAAERLSRFLDASVSLMGLLARACGHDRLDQFNIEDLTTFKSEMSHLSGIRYGGVTRIS